MDHENQELSPTVSQSGEPQEVVLRYEAPVTPIVERYVQPTPLPGQPKKHTSPRKKRKGLKIFLFCMLGLLLVSGVVTALWLGGAFDDHRSYHDDDFEQRHDEDYYDNSEHGETTIKRLPNTDQVKLRYNESHGEALTIQEIYQKVNPSTVTVLTGNRDGSAMVGTGVIFTEDGYILTNAHVIAGGSECYVVLDTGEDYRVRRRRDDDAHPDECRAQQWQLRRSAHQRVRSGRRYQHDEDGLVLHHERGGPRLCHSHRLDRLYDQ